MKSYIEEIVGKTIAGVVIREADSDPRRKVFLVFTDDTHFELYGQYFAFGKHLYPGDIDYVTKSVEPGSKEVSVYPAKGKSITG